MSLKYLDKNITGGISVSEKSGNIARLEKDGLYVPGGEGGASTAEDVKYSNSEHSEIENVKGALDKLFGKVYYVAPSITSFTGNPAAGNREIGQKISEITFAWTTNKDVESQTLTGCTVSETDRSAKYTSELSSNKSFRLTIKDAEGGSTYKDLTYNFLPKVYYGSKALGTIDSAFVVGLSNGDLKSSRGGTYAINVASGQYGIIAFPKSFGTPACKIGGFDTDLTSLGTVSVTNGSGYTQDYNVYRTPNPSLGSISMVIS